MCSNYILHQQHVEEFVVEWLLSLAWVTESFCMSLEGKHEQIIVFRFQWYWLCAMLTNCYVCWIRRFLFEVCRFQFMEWSSPIHAICIQKGRCFKPHCKAVEWARPIRKVNRLPRSRIAAWVWVSTLGSIKHILGFFLCFNMKKIEHLVACENSNPLSVRFHSHVVRFLY